MLNLGIGTAFIVEFFMAAARTNARRRHWGLVTLAVLAALTLFGGLAAACDTPVYRFATYNWTPSPYRIYHIARSAPLATNDPIRQAIAELTTSSKNAPRAVANLELLEIDAAAERPLESLPPPVREEAAFVLERALAAELENGAKLPQFAVVLPNGYPVHEGPITAEDVRAIADSPVRRKLVAQIAAGKAAVMLLLEGDKADDNKTEDDEAAAKLIEATIARAAEGELSPAPDFTLSTTPPDAKPAQVDVGMLRVRRDDPAEKWLVMSLLHLEPEIDERAEPMVFSVYARGRVNPPAIGTGISEEELDRQVKFVLGPCACTIKHDNPGMDLALVADWDEIAFAMAKKYGSETGNEQILGEVPGLFPEVVEANLAAAAEKAAAGELDAPQTSDSKVISEGPQPSSSDEPFEPRGVTNAEIQAEAARSDANEMALVRNVGIGVLVVMALLGIASVALFRRPA
jgi:hypothetical protein